MMRVAIRVARLNKERKTILMRKELIKEAETVEEAVRQAAEEWQVATEDLQVEVLEESKKAFHLFGASHAKVKITYDDGATEVAAQVATAEKAVSSHSENPSKAAENARAYLQTVLDAMGAEMTVKVVSEEADGCKLALEGENEGLIIGRRGETLDALQYLAGLVANRTEEDYYRVSLNVGGYREKREKSLAGLARKHAAAARSGRKISLEPMNPYERRIIHTAVQNIKGVTSWSVGKEPNRYVVIGPSEDNDGRYNRGGRGGRYNNNRGGQRRGGGQRRDTIDRSDVYMRYAGGVDTDRPMREFVSRSNPMPMADGATPPEKTVSQTEEQSDIKLYGRIDL